VMRHLHRLWGFDVHLHSLNGDEITASYHCPELGRDRSEEEESMLVPKPI